MEKIGPLDELVEPGALVWVRHDNLIWAGELVGPGEYDYEVVVRLASEGRQLSVHRYNVQPQEKGE